MLVMLLKKVAELCYFVYARAKMDKEMLLKKN